MKSVYLLTLKTLMRDLKTYIYLAIMFLAEGFFLTYVNLNNSYSAIEYSLEFLELTLILVLPFITAEIFSADRQSGYEKTLLSLGFSGSHLIFGKLLAALTVLLIPQVFLFLIPIIFEAFGIINLASAYASLTAFVLLSISLLSVGVFISLTAKNRLSAYLASYISLLSVYVSGLLSNAIPKTKSLSLLLFTFVLLVISIIIYVFTRSPLIFGGFFCIFEAVFIVLYLSAPKFFASAFSGLLDLLSPCASLNAVIYGPFDLAAIAHIILFTAVFTVLSLTQLKRRKYE